MKDEVLGKALCFILFQGNLANKFNLSISGFFKVLPPPAKTYCFLPYFQQL